MIDLTIWMNYPSAFQTSLFRALAASDEVDLQVIYAKRLPPDRIALGWESELTGYSHRFLDERHEVADAIGLAWSGRSRIHIVNGLWAEPGFAAALVALRITGSRYVIYSEASEPDLPRSPVKRSLRAAFARLLAPRAAGVLAVSRLAEDFYKRLGAREPSIYAFGYFDSEKRPVRGSYYSKAENGVELIFVGQLIHRKGIDLLIEAVGPLMAEKANLYLTIVGSGELMPMLSEQVCSLGLSERIKFDGAMASREIRSRMAVADMLVLPSRWDGWGMVVNEAFSVGIPVIVSDRCGVADLVRDGLNGYIFRSEDVEDLRRCLGQFIEKRAEWPRFRAAAKATAQRITAEQAASYLVKCLKHMTGALSERPIPPWTQLGVAEDIA
ncbi:MAG TPA: glycosyltransferase family 4 protein [Blastocatellia bacterium]|nr:glycosyltransferase family 4 protein [Blastocatellia bacterium]